MLNKFIIFFFLITFSHNMVFAVEAEKEKAAVHASEKWLQLIDNGKYDQSWDEAALFFKNAVIKEQWNHSLNSARKPLGKLISRKVNTTTYRTSLPGALDGEYVVIQFNAIYENKKSATETVTLMLEKDGKWRVSGYYIK